MASITVTSPVPYRVFQRFGTTADIPVTGTYTGSPAAIEASFNGGAYQTIVASPSGGTYSGTLTAQAQGQGTLTVRFTDDHATAASVTLVGIGDVFLCAGQSNSDGRGVNAQTYSHATLKACLWRGRLASPAWQELTDPSGGSTSGPGTAWPVLATQIMASTGVPVAFITYGVGGTALYDATWDPIGGANNAVPGDTLLACIAAVAASGVNGVRGVLWFQGETDALNSVTQAHYLAAMDRLAAYFAANLPGAPPTLVGAISAVTATTAANMDAIRLAQTASWGDGSGAIVGPSTHDLTNDGLHFTSDASIQAFARRWWPAIEQAFYGGGQARGPRLVSAAFATGGRTSVVVVFNQTLKTGLTFSAAPWAVTDTLGAVTVSGVAYHGTNPSAVVLTLAAAATGATTVSFGSGASGNGVTVPLGQDLSLPAGGVANLGAEQFAPTAVAAAPAVLPVAGFAVRGGRR